jgi:excisionase family DNA binding protein
MPLTLAQAAQQTGLNRTTILRWVKCGRISGTKDDTGQWHVEAAELFRVFPAAEASPSAVHQEAQADFQLLARAAEARLCDLRAILDDMRSDRDQWREQAMRLALPAPKVEPGSRWRWLRSTG